MKPDVVIMLGGGVGNTLKPIYYTKERLEGFVARLHKYQGVPVVVCGGQSFWSKKKLKYTEAAVMRHFLIKAGVSPELIHAEERSRDTIGNIYYAKQIVRKHPSWKKVLAVTTLGHGRRAKWLFKNFFGPGYKVNFLEIPSEMPSFKEHPGRDIYERYLIGMYKKRIFKDLAPGDDKAILRMMRKFYSSSKPARALVDELIAKKKALMGYTMLAAKKLKQ